MTDPLFVDCYELDGRKDWSEFISAGLPWAGAKFKLAQGLYYEASAWCGEQRRLFVASARYGIDLFDGFYHYLDLNQDGGKQADYFWFLMQKIGGEKIGTLEAMVDVERGGQRAIPTAQRVFDAVGAWSTRYEALSGRKATLYGGELLRSLGIHRLGAPINLLGCGRNSIAMYNATLPEQVVIETGTDEAHLRDWQYDGDGEAYLPGYPKEAPGCGKIDISVLTTKGGLATLAREIHP